ncbi:hypothetical protein [Luteimonas viscosa]|uniref:hypothetical protein n=1 Tax=Luteimonas viscosa TaxID=1132694 RepID=UPI0016541FE7|nr:hypothetical protein [Luteimonas viscosa]
MIGLLARRGLETFVPQMRRAPPEAAPAPAHVPGPAPGMPAHSTAGDQPARAADAERVP